MTVELRVVGNRVRSPAAAGSFYPGSTDRLALTVDALLEEARVIEIPRPPRAIVVPHAGYQYAGRVAATGYATAARAGVPMERVVLLGPAHFVLLRGIAVPAVDAWRTPLGEVAIDAGLRAAALGAGAVADDGPHAPEHSLEVQLPWLQRLTDGRARVLPVAVGSAVPGAVADFLAAVTADLVVVSTDLSHYRSDDNARRIDAATLRLVVALSPAAIDDDAACGVYALRGVCAWAARLGLSIERLDYRTSADAGGSRRAVVGYAALAIG
jgi:AmmeMemoRadiSam system protein B